MNKKSRITIDPIAAIEQLADQAAQAGQYGLQDANLVLAEAVRELQAEKMASKDLTFLVTTWSEMLGRFKANPQQTAAEIIGFLRRPELNIPMEDDEFAMLGEQIANDASAIDEISPANDPVASLSVSGAISEGQITIVEQLAEQAAAEGLYGLQDVNLLLVESLRELASGGSTIDAGFASAFSRWPDLLANYRKEPKGI